MSASWANLLYLAASVLFILGIQGLTHPRTAVRGNLLAALGMLVAIVTVLASQHILGWTYILSGLVVGSAIGVVLAVRIEMTAMPQMVALLNGFGSIASLLVAGAELLNKGAWYAQVLGTRAETSPLAGSTSRLLETASDAPDAGLHAEVTMAVVAVAASGLIGAVAFSGSMVAYGKLQGLSWFKHDWRFPGLQAINLALFVICLGLGIMVWRDPAHSEWYWALSAAALLLGVLLTMPIGGADMPVVISLLNSYSGMAATATGFVLSNSVLIISGALVGASGLILTQIMCKAMNRSLANVIFARLGPTAATPAGEAIYEGKVKSASADEVAMLFDTARRVVIVPGYGMAVAQAQHAVRDLANLLEARGIQVEYAIHPVAGRMPGHMNVLLAEADIPYDRLKTMDEINPTFADVDVALVIGANDVVNPSAREDPHSPIAGMPILNVDQARTVVVVKRSLAPGFAGIPNPLFAAPNCLMYFADGKKAITDLISAVKEAA